IRTPSASWPAPGRAFCGVCGSIAARTIPHVTAPPSLATPWVDTGCLITPPPGAAQRRSRKRGGPMTKRASMTIIALCQVAAMALWFSASAVVPALAAEFHLSNFAQATLTSAVQIGFVIGCLASAILGLADRLELRRLFAASA